MVWDTGGADASGLGLSHQEPDSLLRTEGRIEDDGKGFGGAGVGVSGGRRGSLAACGFARIRGLRRLVRVARTNQGAAIEPFWSLVQYTMFAVQARYEEGVADMDETIDRTAEIAHVSALLTHVEKLLAAKPLG